MVLCLAVTLIISCHHGCRPEEGKQTVSAESEGQSTSRATLERIDVAEEAGMSTEGLASVLDVVRTHIEKKTTPGAVVLIARRGKIVLEEALGRMSYEADAEPMTPGTIFDLASVTKVAVTTTLAMMLSDRGALDLDASVKNYVPEFQGEGKEQVTMRDLFAHCSGMRSWVPFFREIEATSPAEAKSAVIEAICRMPQAHPWRSKTAYSDPAYILLGEVVERIAGQPLDTLAEEWIFGPLGMEDTLYWPPPSLLHRIAPTELDPWRGRVRHGPRRSLRNGVGSRGLRADVGERRCLQRATICRGRDDSGLDQARRACPREQPGGRLGHGKGAGVTARAGTVDGLLAYRLHRGFVVDRSRARARRGPSHQPHPSDP
jgi:CubicO group peptidase (beta-lactamase class C family)